MGIRTLLIGAAAAAIASLGGAALAAPAIDLTVPGVEYSGSLYTLGFSFTVGTNETITALGAYDSGADGLTGRAQVGLSDSVGTLLTSVTVPGGTVGTLDGLFRYASITPFALTPGAVYYLGAFEPDGLATSLGTGQGGAGSVNPLVNVIQDQFSPFDSSFGFPGSTNSHPGGAWLGANFELGGGVPEPAVWGMMLLGFFGVGLSLRADRKLRRLNGAA
jgi:hypothetical protein